MSGAPPPAPPARRKRGRPPGPRAIARAAAASSAATASASAAATAAATPVALPSAYASFTAPLLDFDSIFGSDPLVPLLSENLRPNLDVATPTAPDPYFPQPETRSNSRLKTSKPPSHKEPDKPDKNEKSFQCPDCLKSYVVYNSYKYHRNASRLRPCTLTLGLKDLKGVRTSASAKSIDNSLFGLISGDTPTAVRPDMDLFSDMLWSDNTDILNHNNPHLSEASTVDFNPEDPLDFLDALSTPHPQMLTMGSFAMSSPVPANSNENATSKKINAETRLETGISRVELDMLFEDYAAEAKPEELNSILQDTKSEPQWAWTAGQIFSAQQLLLLKLQMNNNFQIVSQAFIIEKERHGPGADNTLHWERQLKMLDSQRNWAIKTYGPTSYHNTTPISKLEQILNLHTGSSGRQRSAASREFVKHMNFQYTDSEYQLAKKKMNGSNSVAVSKSLAAGKLTATVVPLSPSLIKLGEICRLSWDKTLVPEIFRVRKRMNEFLPQEDALLARGILVFGSNDLPSIRAHCLPVRTVDMLSARIKAFEGRKNKPNAIKTLMLRPFKPITLIEKDFMREGIRANGQAYLQTILDVFPQHPIQVIKAAWTTMHLLSEVNCPFPTEDQVALFVNAVEDLNVDSEEIDDSDADSDESEDYSAESDESDSNVDDVEFKAVKSFNDKETQDDPSKSKPMLFDDLFDFGDDSVSDEDDADYVCEDAKPSERTNESDANALEPRRRKPVSTRIHNSSAGDVAAESSWSFKKDDRKEFALKLRKLSLAAKNANSTIGRGRVAGRGKKKTASRIPSVSASASASPARDVKMSSLLSGRSPGRASASPHHRVSSSIFRSSPLKPVFQPTMEELDPFSELDCEVITDANPFLDTGEKTPTHADIRNMKLFKSSITVEDELLSLLQNSGGCEKPLSSVRTPTKLLDDFEWLTAGHPKVPGTPTVVHQNVTEYGHKEAPSPVRRSSFQSSPRFPRKQSPAKISDRCDFRRHPSPLKPPHTGGPLGERVVFGSDDNNLDLPNLAPTMEATTIGGGGADDDDDAMREEQLVASGLSGLLAGASEQGALERRVGAAIESEMRARELENDERRLAAADARVRALEAERDALEDAGRSTARVERRVDAARAEKDAVERRMRARALAAAAGGDSRPRRPTAPTTPHLAAGDAAVGRSVKDLTTERINEMSKKRRLRDRRSSSADSDSRDEFDESTASVDNEGDVNAHQKLESFDDGDEFKYQKRYAKWVENRRITRMIRNDPNFTYDSEDEDSPVHKDIFTEPTVALHNDLELSPRFIVPGDIASKLFPYQLTTLSWLLELHNQQTGGILGDEMGLGKTIQIISFLAGLHRSGMLNTKKAILIIAPATVLNQWVKEFHTWWGAMRVVILHASGSGVGNLGRQKRESSSEDFSEESDTETERRNRRKGQSQTKKSTTRERKLNPQAQKQLTELVNRVVEGGHVLITTYEGLRVHRDVLLPVPWAYAILDEGHKIRNADAEITLVCKRLRTPHRIILSGTPIQNNLKELWSLYDFVFPGRLGTLPVFLVQFEVPIRLGAYANASSLQIQTAQKCAAVLRDLISPYLLRRLKRDVAADLPQKTESVLFCKLTKIQRGLYETFIRSDVVRGAVEGKRNALGAIDGVRKICNHPDLLTRDVDRAKPGYGDPEKSGKMQVLKQLLAMWQKQGHRALVFCQTRQMQEILQRFVQAEGYKFLQMDGMTPIKQRIGMVDTYNSDTSILVFLLTTKVGGLGINLTGADRVLIFDPDWNPSTDVQARERAWRLGQTRNVAVYRLMMSGTIEEKIYHRQIYKQFMTDKILTDPGTAGEAAAHKRFFDSRSLKDLFVLSDGDALGTETGDLFAGTEMVSKDKIAAADISEKRAAHAAPLHTGLIPVKKEASTSALINSESDGRDGLDTIGDIAKVEPMGDVKEEENIETGEQPDQDETLLFSLLHSTVAHDKIVGADGAALDPLTVAQADRVAREAAEEVRLSRKRVRAEQKRASQASGQYVGIVTFTGLSGSAGRETSSASRNSSVSNLPRVPGLSQQYGNHRGGSSSASILDGLRKRK
ncbi:hypothetical protein HDU84_007139 [Entophlyctis sp. JEL0112]|nr:hypothetical protein HDU84_007139 [Entophlyctis sp. JEL0112]